MSKWQPIDTAPNGKDVLIYDRGRQLVACRFLPAFDWVAAGSKESYNFIPTHWMPLPEQPK